MLAGNLLKSPAENDLTKKSCSLNFEGFFMELYEELAAFFFLPSHHCFSVERARSFLLARPGMP